MTRRLGGRVNTAERPRQKGWWGTPEEEELLQETSESATPPAREPARRLPQPRPAHSITQVGRALTPGQVEAIRTVMQLFVDDDTARGVDTRTTLLCHRCQAPRRAIGSVRYDRFTFCNECSTDYEITRARGLVETPNDYYERTLSRAVSA